MQAGAYARGSIPKNLTLLYIYFFDNKGCKDFFDRLPASSFCNQVRDGRAVEKACKPMSEQVKGMTGCEGACTKKRQLKGPRGGG